MGVAVLLLPVNFPHHELYPTARAITTRAAAQNRARHALSLFAGPADWVGAGASFEFSEFAAGFVAGRTGRDPGIAAVDGG